MNVLLRCVWMAIGVLVLTPHLLPGQEAKEPERHAVMANGYYAREATDREWHVRLVGTIPSLCGAYLVIHDAAGKTIHHGVIPHGEYPEEKPYEIAIKPDGIVGDYKIVLLGHQNDMLGVTVPYTDLPFETYGGANFAIGHDLDVKPYFKAPPGIVSMKLGAYKGHLKVTDRADKVVADTRVGGKLEKYDNTIAFDVTPDETYRLHRDCFYFRSYLPGTFFMAFDPARWFCPTSTLDQVKWWEGVK